MLVYNLTLNVFVFFFFNDTATTEIYTLSLHDALPIFAVDRPPVGPTPEWPRQSRGPRSQAWPEAIHGSRRTRDRSEEHTSELQSPCNLVCRLLLEKKEQRIQ